MPKIVVVDDSYAEMKMLESILKRADYSVVAMPDADHIEDMGYPKSMEKNEISHNCHFILEQTAKGYFTGKFVCTLCGMKVAQMQLFETLIPNPAAGHSGHEPPHGLSRAS